MPKYTHVHFVSLEGRFEPGTIGSEMEYVCEPKLPEHIDIQDSFIQEETNPETTVKDLDMFYAFVDPEETNSDEFFTKFGYNPTTDPRSCINRKRK